MTGGISHAAASLELQPKPPDRDGGGKGGHDNERV